MNSERHSRALAQELVATLLARGETLGLAESCTGGRIATAITSVPGCSEMFLGGVVTYANSTKHNLLGVHTATLNKHGAVSPEVASAMASGARRMLGCHWSIAVSGIAGPGGGSAEKPVGTVFIGVASPAGVEVRRFRFPGGRTAVKWQSAQAALDMLRRALSR